MQREILALFGVCLAFAVGELLLPQSASATTRRALRFLVSLVVLLLILAPFKAFLQDNTQFFKGEIAFEEADVHALEEIFEEAVRAQSEQDIIRGLQELLAAEYGIAREDSTVLVSFDTDGTPRRICVFLSGEALTKNPKALERALCERLGITVEVR